MTISGETIGFPSASRAMLAADERGQFRTRSALHDDAVARIAGRGERRGESVRHGAQDDEDRHDQGDAADREKRHAPADQKTPDVVGQGKRHQICLRRSVIRAR
jgi:hypothetical protein